MQPAPLLRPFWKGIFRHSWILSIVLFLLLGGLRAYGLLGPADARMLVMGAFFSMWFLPFLFFSRQGRAAIGIKQAENKAWILLGILFGLAGGFAVYGVGYALFGNGENNWYVSLLNSYQIDDSMRQMPTFALFLIFTIPAMLFSPVGEEFFFRGMIHESAIEAGASGTAVWWNALAFAAVHLLHHGITLGSARLRILPISGVIWFFLMLGLSWIFTQCRLRSGSIWPAVLAHAAFNLSMNIALFLFIPLSRV
jgi:membrane protease YdiL (CAAX protease family)